MNEFHIKKPMVQKHGHSEGCPACQKFRNMSHGGRPWIGRLGVNHSIGCKSMTMQKMKDDLIDRHIVEGYLGRAKHDQADQDKQMYMSKSDAYCGSSNGHKTETLLGVESMMMKMTTNTRDVAEIYSPERVASMAEKMGLDGG